MDSKASTPRRKRAGLAVLAASLFAPMAFGGCMLPSAPSKIPSAQTANESEMRAAMQTLKRYDTDVNTYVKCLAFEIKQGRLPAADGARLHNVALEKLDKAAQRFNEQMRIFLGH